MFPKVICEVGFASDPAMSVSDTTWTDVSAYLLEASGSGGGKQYELDQDDAGTMTVRFDNRDRRFEPEYSGSPYYPDVVPLRRIRLRIGENAVTNPSLEVDTTGWTVGAQFSVARSTTQFLVGDASLKSTFVSGSASSDMGAITVAVPAAGRYAFTAYVYIPTAWNGGTISVNAENYTGATEVTASRQDSTSARDSFQRISRVYDFVGGDLSGELRIRCSSFPTGTPFIYIDAVQVATLDGKGTLQPYVDQVRNKFTGFVEAWPPSYAQRWSYVDVPCVDGFEPLEQTRLIGGPNLVANPSFEVDASSWGTVNGGTVSRDTTRFVAGVACGKLNGNATLTPVDARPSGLGLEAGSYYAMSTRVWLPSGLGIAAGSVTAGLGVTGGAETAGTAQSLFDQWQTITLPSLFSGDSQVRTFGLTTPGTGLTVMQGDTASNGDPVGSNKQVTKFTLTDPAVITSLHMDITGHGGAGPQMLVKGVIYADSAGTPGLKLGETDERTIPRNSALRQFEQFDFSESVTVAAGDYWIGYIGGETSQSLYIGSVAAGGSRAYSTDSYSDGAADSFGSATTDTLELAVYATYTVSLASTSYGFIRLSQVGTAKYVNFDEVVVRAVPVTDGDLTDPAGADLTSAQVGFRIHRLLNAANWPVSDRTIDDGQSTVADETAASDSSTSILSETRSAAQADLGSFFCNGDGDAVFHGRERRFNPSSSFTFSDGTISGGTFPYANVVPSFDKTRIANDVRVSPAAGTTQIVSDAASVTTYMQRTLAQSLPLESEDDAQYLAQGILYRQKDPHLRLDTLEIIPVAHEARQPGFLNSVLAAENSDAVTVVLHPPGGGTAVAKLVHREKASFELNHPAFLTESWQLSPADTTAYMELDDAALGVLDTNAVAF